MYIVWADTLFFSVEEKWDNIFSFLVWYYTWMKNCFLSGFFFNQCGFLFIKFSCCKYLWFVRFYCKLKRSFLNSFRIIVASFQLFINLNITHQNKATALSIWNVFSTKFNRSPSGGSTKWQLLSIFSHSTSKRALSAFLWSKRDSRSADSRNLQDIIRTKKKLTDSCHIRQDVELLRGVDLGSDSTTSF